MQPVVLSTQHVARLTEKLRDNLKQVAALKQQLGDGTALTGPSAQKLELLRVQGTVLLMELREAGRDIWTHVETQKAACTQTKLSLEPELSELQALQYEKNVATADIRECRDWQPSEVAPQLDKEYFLANAPAHLTTVTESADPHQFHLNQLCFELQQRKQSCMKLAELKARKEKLTAHNAAKAKFMAELKPQVQAVLDASAGLQQFMTLPTDKPWEHDQKVQALPAPLYLLYNQACAYKDASSAPMEIAVSGNQVAARVTPTEDTEEFTQSAPKKQKASLQPTDRHPLSVTLSLLQETSKKSLLTLTFHYFPVLHLIGVTSEGAQPGGVHKMLGGLFPNDTGATFPNDNTLFAASRLSNSSPSPSVAMLQPAVPYRWAQQLCGMPSSNVEAVEPGCSGSSSLPSTVTASFEVVVQTLRNRIGG